MSSCLPLLARHLVENGVARLILVDMRLGDSAGLTQADTLVVADGSRVQSRTDAEHDLCFCLGEPMHEGCAGCVVGRAMIPPLAEEDEASDQHFACAHVRGRPGDEAYDAVVPLLRLGLVHEQRD